jgi:hypothetical protein
MARLPTWLAILLALACVAACAAILNAQQLAQATL